MARSAPASDRTPAALVCGHLELDLWARCVDGIDDLQSTQSFVADLAQAGEVPVVDYYTTLAARLSWRPRKDLELSLVGRNLVDSERVEFLREVGTFPTRTERSIYGQIRWQL